MYHFFLWESSWRLTQVSETQASALAEAFWNDFGDLEGAQGKPSANFYGNSIKTISHGTWLLVGKPL